MPLWNQATDVVPGGPSVHHAAEYSPQEHSAARTSHYIYSQLIPYIGNKRKLLPLISAGIEQTQCRSGVFVDLFTGSTVVARLAKILGFQVLANDWEPYSYEIARGTVGLNYVPAFSGLGGFEAVFNHLNHLRPLRGYIATHLCPQDDEDADPNSERMFFTRHNGERIDAVREQIAQWENEGRISLDERAYLLSALIYSVSYVSNTSGVFKAYHNGWGGSTGTALYRIRSTLELKPPVLFDNYTNNIFTREDSSQLAPNLEKILGVRPDIVYIDPPYNQHPYGSNYHVLNTVSLWDKPPLNIAIRVNGRVREKSAIRKDWRTERRSPYNTARQALPAFRQLIQRLDARWILVSYSTDGNISIRGLLRSLAERGAVSVLTQTYKRYRVSTPRMSPKAYNVEFLAVVDTDGPCSVGQVDELVNRIMRQEGCALNNGRHRNVKQLSLFS